MKIQEHALLGFSDHLTKVRRRLVAHRVARGGAGTVCLATLGCRRAIVGSVRHWLAGYLDYNETIYGNSLLCEVRTRMRTSACLSMRACPWEYQIHIFTM